MEKSIKENTINERVEIQLQFETLLLVQELLRGEALVALFGDRELDATALGQ